MRHVAFLVMAVMLGATRCHAASVEGYWYGAMYQPEIRQTMEWLAILHSGGALSVEFRTYDNCQLKSSRIETGWWTVSGSLITNKILTVDGRPVPDTAYYHRTYEILELNDRKMRFAHEKSRQERTVERVTPDFTFPECKVS